MSRHSEETRDRETRLRRGLSPASFVHQKETRVPLEGEHDRFGLSDVEIRAEPLDMRPIGWVRDREPGRDVKSIGEGNSRVAATSSTWTAEGIRTCW